MLIVPCTKEDFRRTVDFYRLVVRHLEETVNYPKWSAEHPSEKGIADAIANGTQYICTEDGEIVGAFVLNGDPEGDYSGGDWSCALAEGKFLVIHALAVHPIRAHTGVGSNMVDACIAMAKSRGCHAIRLDVVPGNFPAAALYRKKGFRYAGTKDLRRNIHAIPVFDLFELNFQQSETRVEL